MPGRFEGDDLRNRSRTGGTAKWAVLEMLVNSRVVVQMMRKHSCRKPRRTYFQQKRRTARRHEADGHVRSKQKHRQQEAGE